MKYLKSFFLFEQYSESPQKILQEFDEILRNTQEGADILKWFNVAPRRTGRIQIFVKDPGKSHVYLPVGTYFEKIKGTSGTPDFWQFVHESTGHRYGEKISYELKSLFREFIKEMVKKNLPSNVSRKEANEFIEGSDKYFPLGKLPDDIRVLSDMLLELKMGGDTIKDFIPIVKNDEFFQKLVEKKFIGISEVHKGGFYVATTKDDLISNTLDKIANLFDIEESDLRYVGLYMIFLPGIQEKTPSLKNINNQLEIKLKLSYKDPKELMEVIKSNFSKSIKKTFLKVRGNHEFNDLFDPIFKAALDANVGINIFGVENLEEKVSKAINDKIEKMDPVVLGNLIRGLRDIIDIKKLNLMLDPSINIEDLSKGASIIKRFGDV